MEKTGRDRFDWIASAARNARNLGAIAILPDYFVDRFLKIPSFEKLVTAIRQKGIEGGGGSIRAGIRQQEAKGGNAVNLGYALGALGARVDLIAIANSLHASVLKSIFAKLESVNLSLVDGDPGFTIAFEYLHRGRRVNVMVSDIGALGSFQSKDLSEEQWNSIGNSKIVGIVNWGSLGYGNELSEDVFSLARKKGAKTFFDSADVAEKSAKLPRLKKSVFDKALVDYISMNDNEARIMARVFEHHRLPASYSDQELKKTVRVLSDSLGSRVDLHSRKLSLSCDREDLAFSPCHKVDQKIVTGAGDVWDSADLVGYLTGMEPEDRLYFANTAAGLYVSRETPEPPTLAEILSFMQKQ